MNIYIYLVSLLCGYLQQIEGEKSIHENDPRDTCFRVSLLPKSRCLCRASLGVLDFTISVDVLADKQCKHHSAIRVSSNLPFSSDHRRIGEAKNPGPAGRDQVEITIGI